MSDSMITELGALALLTRTDDGEDSRIVASGMADDCSLFLMVPEPGGLFAVYVRAEEIEGIKKRTQLHLSP
jgi:hypothetical protein